MNVYDKRAESNIIKSRVIKTATSKMDCKDCKLDLKPCPNGCPFLTVSMHLDTGFIIYISTKEVEHLSKAYKEAVNTLLNPEQTPNAELDETPF